MKKSGVHTFKKTQWLRDARLGTFIHFGPYAQYGRGEQVLVREFLDQNEYADRAMTWKTPRFDAKEWVKSIKKGGSKYIVFTTRHMDGFCMWDTATTNYNSMRSAAKRDYVSEIVSAAREVGLKIGLYHSLADSRIPAYYAGARQDPRGFKALADYNHAQVKELMTNYGKIDLLWFDAAVPHSAEDWQSERLIAYIRSVQSHVIVNDRLGAWRKDMGPKGDPWRNYTDRLSDYNTCEQRLLPFPRTWEMCDTTTWLWWGFTTGERWKTPLEVVDLLCKVVSRGGTLLLNVGPKPDGSLPKEYLQIQDEMGKWLKTNGDAIYGAGSGMFRPSGVIEFNTYGWQTTKGNSLFCIFRFWHGEPTLVLRGIQTELLSAKLLGSRGFLRFTQQNEEIAIMGLPEKIPNSLFPVLKLEFKDIPRATGKYQYNLWEGDFRRVIPWVKTRRIGRHATDYIPKNEH